MQRLRLTFAKTEAMRFTGHLDLHTAWERTFRRARLPLAYSQGYHPQPRLQLAAALPLGFTSECEIADVWLETPQEPEAVRAALEAALPPGLKLLSITEVPPAEPALQTQVRSAEYLVTLDTDWTAEELDARLAALLAQPSIPRVRRGKAYDLRPLIESAERAGDARTLRLQLAAREGATGRPEEVVEALGIGTVGARFHRTRLILAA
ncbi:MAG: TIGR03936 family radical SAM-associated protein [Anaerolineales bacterium]|nr:TIGR03936 family radical SAM-associated protein [Anaerolineales bacterium]